MTSWIDRSESSSVVRGDRPGLRVVPTLDIAARSLLESQAIAGTVASMVAGRALDHHWESLFQYAAVRVGPEAAARLLEALEKRVEEESSEEETDRHQSPRAQLYHLMRGLVSEAPKKSMDPGANAWWAPANESLRARLIELRATLPAEIAEVLELRYARSLTVADLAHVLGLSSEEVERRITDGLARTERLLGRRPQSRDRTLEGALLEAFALDPRRTRAPRRSRRKPVLEKGAVIAGRYEIEALLGAGAFADVYRARDRDVTDHVVALKILRTASADTRSVKAALRELQLIASVFHPSVVQLKDHGWHEGRLWFVMPLYRGETLATRLSRGALSRREAREIFEPLTEALASMHRAGVRHQDVKPENVFLAQINPETGAQASPRRILPVLLDLGVAAKDAELVLAGTPAYFAPEVAARFAGAPDPAPVGPKADVFSLALTLRRALDPDTTEEVAGGAVDAFVAFRATRTPNAPSRGDLRDLRPYFERWLNLSPDQRPSSEELYRELAVLTRPEEMAERRWSVMRWAIPTAVAVLALFSAVVYVLSREAALQRLEAAQARERADRARERAASISASLSEQQARRKELEAHVTHLEQQYQSSRLTREQLASRLAQTEGDLAMLVDQKSIQALRLRQHETEERELKREQKQLKADLETNAARLSDVQADLERTEHSLDSERSRRVDAENSVGQLRDQLKSANAEQERTRERIEELEARVHALKQVLTGPPAPRPTRQQRPDEL
ncbi:MAG: protein kinase [Myxococcales bacterium]